MNLLSSRPLFHNALLLVENAIRAWGIMPLYIASYLSRATCQTSFGGSFSTSCGRPVVLGRKDILGQLVWHHVRLYTHVYIHIYTMDSTRFLWVSFGVRVFGDLASVERRQVENILMR